MMFDIVNFALKIFELSTSQPFLFHSLASCPPLLVLVPDLAPDIEGLGIKGAEPSSSDSIFLNEIGSLTKDKFDSDLDESILKSRLQKNCDYQYSRQLDLEIFLDLELRFYDY